VQNQAHLEARAHIDLLRLNKFQQHQKQQAALTVSTEAQTAQVGQRERATSVVQSAQLAAYGAGRASSPNYVMLSGMGGCQLFLLQRSGMHTAMPSPCIGSGGMGVMLGQCPTPTRPQL